jgi:hypothetical protein
MNKFLEELLKWIKETFPTAFAVGISVYGHMLSQLRKEEKAHDKTKLEKELVENELANSKEFADRTNVDVIDSVILPRSKNS